MILIDSAFETACRSFLQHKVKIKLGDNRKHRDTLISTMKSKLGEVDIAVWDNINFYIKPVLGYGDRISEQQMLAIARALMSTPRLLLLDEPSLGLAPTMVETVFRVIAEIRRQGVTVLMVE